MPDTNSSPAMTLEQFEDCLLDGERWVELSDGELIRLNPPDDAHGDVVRNFSKAIAAYFKSSSNIMICNFELPLIIRREPPTVRCPAVSFFESQSEGRFNENELMTDVIPKVVIEIASTNDRRSAIAKRVKAYQDWGVFAVWVIDPQVQQVHQFHGQDGPRMLKSPQVLLGHPVLPGFALPVSDLFRQPDWMKGDR